MGEMRVEATTDAAAAIARSAGLLAARPVALNVIWSVMTQRAERGGRGRYWLLEDDGEIAGLVIESPPGQAACISPLDRAQVQALAAAIAAEGHRLSGVSGDASTASVFAGSWTERVKVAAVVTDAQLLYALGRLNRPRGVPGGLRPAERKERELLVEWWSAFELETGAGGEAASSVDIGLSAGRLFVWDDGGARSMARATAPLGGISRIGIVFTPPQWRRRGYAAACVGALCEWVRNEEGANSVLYAQLANPGSNAVYRRLGFEVFSEALVYRFDEAEAAQ